MIKIAAEPLLQYSPLFIGPMNGCHIQARQHESPRKVLILPGEQRHIGVNNLPRVVSLPDNAMAGSRTRDLTITSPTP